MTQFGFRSDTSSPARQRIEAAGRAYVERKTKEREAAEDGIRRAKAQRHDELLKWAAESDAARAAHIAERLLYGGSAMRIIHSVAEKYQVRSEDITGTLLTRDITAIRHECFWLIWTELGWSHPRIGKLFGREHTTVLNGVRNHAKRMDEERAK